MACWRFIVTASYKTNIWEWTHSFQKSRIHIYFCPFIFPSGCSSWAPLAPEWHSSSLFSLRCRQMLEFTAKVSSIRLPDSPALNQRKQPLISGQWAESLHFWSLPPADRKWLFLLVPGVLLVQQPSDFIRAWMRPSERQLRWIFKPNTASFGRMIVCSLLFFCWFFKFLFCF